MSENEIYSNIPLDLPLEVVAYHAIEAHRRNITLNQWINQYLAEIIKEYENVEIDLEFNAAKVELTKKAIYNLEKISESD